MNYISSRLYFIVIQTAYDKVAEGSYPHGIKSHHNIYTMDKAYLRKSTDKDAKWDVTVFNGSSPITITFGGFWSRWLLWSKPDLEEAKDYIETKFNIKIIMGKPPRDVKFKE